MTNDLISRSELMKKSIRVSEFDEGDWERVLRAVPVENIEAAEAVDAAPVVHGRWIENGPNWVCSYCGTEFKDEIEFIKLDYDYYMPLYCPNCGARMDKEAT